MAKDKKSAAKEAAKKVVENQQAPSTESNNKDSKRVAVIQLGDIDKIAKDRAINGLDPNHTVDLLKIMHETYRADKNAADRYNMSKEAVEEINRITAIGQVAMLTQEIILAQTPFAISMRVSQLEAIKEVAPLLGVTINQKSLPSPNAEKDTVEVPSAAFEISKETKNTVENEQKETSSNTNLDPTKVEGAEQLKKSLLSILVKGNGSENLYDKISTAINFYAAHLKFNASKSDDKEAALAEINKKSQCDLLTEISDLLRTCPFVVKGITKFMYETVQNTKSPVAAFCMFRDASLNKKTGMPKIDDQLVADIVKVLVRWYVNSEIETTNNVINGFKESLKLLEKDPKKNAKGIEQGKQKIAYAENHIKEVNEVLNYVYNPSKEVIDGFTKNYTDNKSEGFKSARMIGSKILKTYYGNSNITNIKQESLVYNLQQYVGVIANMFLPPMNRIVEYSEANIGELEKVDETKKELRLRS